VGRGYRRTSITSTLGNSEKKVSDYSSYVTALLIIDMQVGLFRAETPRYDANGVVNRINALARAVRENGDIVVFIQHNGAQGDPLEQGTEGWQIIPALERYPSDVIVNKTACNSFYKTELTSILDRKKVRRLIITGCATDFCVDATIQAAISRDYKVVVVADGHTTTDRPHIDARSLIRHHNWLWQNLIHPKLRIEVRKMEELIEH
jgi:nicotinamidase-related amidase